MTYDAMLLFVLMEQKLDYSLLSDETLVQMFQESNSMAIFDFVFERYRTKIYQKVYFYTKNEMDAEDVTQEIFLKLHSKIPQFQFKSQFKTWLYRLVVNTCLDFIKLQKIRTSVSIDDQTINNSDVSYIEEYQDTREEFHETIQMASDSDISVILKKMKPTDATILTLRFLDDMKLEQIGVILQIQTNTVKQRLHRARRRFIDIYDTHFSE